MTDYANDLHSPGHFEVLHPFVAIHSLSNLECEYRSMLLERCMQMIAEVNLFVIGHVADYLMICINHG